MHHSNLDPNRTAREPGEPGEPGEPNYIPPKINSPRKLQGSTLQVPVLITYKLRTRGTEKREYGSFFLTISQSFRQSREHTSIDEAIYSFQAQTNLLVVSMLCPSPMRVFVRVLCLSLVLFQTSAFARNDPSCSFRQSSNSNSLFDRCLTAVQMLPAGCTFALANYHLATESATAGFMAGVGDMVGKFEKIRIPQPEKWDLKPYKLFLFSTFAAQKKKPAVPYSRSRGGTFVMKGLIEGIMWSFWYELADKWSLALTSISLRAIGGVPGTNLEVILRTVISLVMDQMIAAPTIYGLWDIPFPAYMNGVPFRKLPGQVKSKLGEILIANMKLWTPVNIVIYNAPLKYRVILSATADVFWQSIVSSIATREDRNEPPAAGFNLKKAS